jgi:type I restriction-modification system DNA methylase subunit
VSDWGGERLGDDVRWKYGVPPISNANFAWVQHMIYHLSPTGVAGFVLANGSLSSNIGGEGEIRRSIVEDDLGTATRCCGSLVVPDRSKAGPIAPQGRPVFRKLHANFREDLFWALG